MKSIKYRIPSVPRSVHDAVEMSNKVRSIYIPSVPKSVHDAVEVWHKYKDAVVIDKDICNCVYLLNLINEINDSVDFFEKEYNPKEIKFETKIKNYSWKMQLPIGDTLFEFLFEKYKNDLSVFVESSDDYLDDLHKEYYYYNKTSKERLKDRQTPDKQFDEIFVSENHKDFVCKMMVDLQIIDNDFNYIGRGKPSNRTLISSLIEVCIKEYFFSSYLTNTELGRIFLQKMKLNTKRLTKSTETEKRQIRDYISKNNV